MTDHTEANALAVEHMGLVQKIAGKVSVTLPSHIAIDDLTAAGYVGLVQASRSFDSTRNVPFGAYARRRIRGAMFDWIREMDWVPQIERARLKANGESPVFMGSLDHILGDAKIDNELSLRTALAVRHHGPEHDLDVADFWADPIDGASDTELRILQMYYRDGMTQRQIGAIFGFSESRTNQILLAIRRRHAS